MLPQTRMLPSRWVCRPRNLCIVPLMVKIFRFFLKACYSDGERIAGWARIIEINQIE